MRLFDNRLMLVERSLDIRLERHGRLAGNLANIDTPKFTPKDIDFDTAIEEARRSIESSPSEAGRADLRGSFEIEGPSGTPTPDGNRVDLDGTMAAISENSIKYNALSKVAQKRLAMLRYAAADGQG